MNSNNYWNIVTIKNIDISMYSRENMELIENDLLCLGGDNTKLFYLIKISNHQINKIIICV